jgi:hypothetical protein
VLVLLLVLVLPPSFPLTLLVRLLPVLEARPSTIHLHGSRRHKSFLLTTRV